MLHENVVNVVNDKQEDIWQNDNILEIINAELILHSIRYNSMK